MQPHALDHGSFETITAPIGYMLDNGVKQSFFQSDVAGVDTSSTEEREYRHVVMRNARTMDEVFTLDTHGFALVGHASAMVDFYDNDEVARVYDREAEALIRASTGAAHVIVFDHTRRSSDPAIRKARNARDPAGIAHTDYTDWSAAKRVREIVGDEEAEERLQKRFAIINVWRSIAGTIAQWPMAFCDARSIVPEQLIAVQRRTKIRIGETSHAVFDENNRWIYFPDMRADEAVLVKNYDTGGGDIAPYALHTAFDDPASPPDAPARESLETRTMAFFD